MKCKKRDQNILHCNFIQKGNSDKVRPCVTELASSYAYRMSDLYKSFYTIFEPLQMTSHSYHFIVGGEYNLGIFFGMIVVPTCTNWKP